MRSPTAIPVHPAPWWFRLAQRWFPNRCREIPEPTDPNRTLIRQFALWKRHVYLESFSSSENQLWMHSHQWRWTIAIGLWGSYIERRLAGRWLKFRDAPYCYVMGHDVVHNVDQPTAGHTSLLIGLWRDDSMKYYFPTAANALDERRPWSAHIQRFVTRL